MSQKVKDFIGSTMSLIGLGWIAGAAEGRGNIVIAVAVFVIGFSMVLRGYQK